MHELDKNRAFVIPVHKTDLTTMGFLENINKARLLTDKIDFFPLYVQLYVSISQLRAISRLYNVVTHTHGIQKQYTWHFQGYFVYMSSLQLVPGSPTQCYLGYAYAFTATPPPLSAKVRVWKVNTGRPFSFVIRAFFSTPPPPFSAKVRCVKSIWVDLFLLLWAGEFGITHGIPPFTEWGGGGGGTCQTQQVLQVTWFAMPRPASQSWQTYAVVTCTHWRGGGGGGCPWQTVDVWGVLEF